jgi:hypothetical protein
VKLISIVSLRVPGQILGQKFQGDKTTEVGILGLVHHTHAAAAQLLNDAVMRNGLAEQRVRHSALARANMLGVRKGQVNGPSQHGPSRHGPSQREGYCAELGSLQLRDSALACFECGVGVFPDAPKRGLGFQEPPPKLSLGALTSLRQEFLLALDSGGANLRELCLRRGGLRRSNGRRPASV